MSPPSGTPQTNGTPQTDGLPAEVSRSLESVWVRHAGAAPQKVETVIRADTIICTIRGGTVGFSQGMVDPSTFLSDKAKDGMPTTYRSDALAAVEEATGRHVKFFTSRSDSAADVATEIFTLDEA